MFFIFNKKQIKIEDKTIIRFINKKNKIDIATDKNEYVFLIAGDPKIQVGNAETTNIQKGLDLEGGTRALLEPVADNNQTVTSQQINDLISVLENRLNVYGLKDLKIRPVTDLSGSCIYFILYFFFPFF